MNLKFWKSKKVNYVEELKVTEADNIPCCDGNVGSGEKYLSPAQYHDYTETTKKIKQPFQEIDLDEIIRAKNNTIRDLRSIVKEWEERYVKQAQYGYEDTKHIETLKLVCDSRELEIYKLWEYIETLQQLVAVMKKRRKKR